MNEIISGSTKEEFLDRYKEFEKNNYITSKTPLFNNNGYSLLITYNSYEQIYKKVDALKEQMKIDDKKSNKEFFLFVLGLITVFISIVLIS